jgi:long-chain acyl-CoA synthetase
VLDADDERLLAAALPADPVTIVDDESPVLELFTAAFTGQPRGVLLTHRGIVTQNLVLAAMREIEGYGEVYLASGPMFHIGVLLKLFALLHLGGRTVIIPRVDAEAVCRAVHNERCTSAFLFPPTIGEIAEHNAGGKFDLSSLRSVPGQPPEAVRAAWYAMTSCVPPTDGGVTGYGQTETLGMVTFSGRPPPGIGAFGRPSPVVAVRIVDGDGAEVPDGELGEIVVRGPQLMLGYHDEAPEPDGWHHTNDLGRREVDGTISFLGPKLDLIKTGMENVYPTEVENVLRQHPGVADACVIGIPDEVWGQSVRAVVQPVPGRTLAAQELVEFVRERIASYKKPRSVVLVDALPRSGPMVDRTEVKRRWSTMHVR